MQLFDRSRQLGPVGRERNRRRVLITLGLLAAAPGPCLWRLRCPSCGRRCRTCSSGRTGCRVAPCRPSGGPRTLSLPAAIGRKGEVGAMAQGGRRIAETRRVGSRGFAGVHVPPRHLELVEDPDRLAVGRKPQSDGRSLVPFPWEDDRWAPLSMSSSRTTCAKAKEPTMARVRPSGDTARARYRRVFIPRIAGCSVKPGTAQRRTVALRSWRAIHLRLPDCRSRTGLCCSGAHVRSRKLPLGPPP